MRGFALLIVLWTMGFLALLGTQLVAAGRSDTQLTGNLKTEAVLEAAADGAVSHALFQLQAARDPGWRADAVDRRVRIGSTQVIVRIENETDRVNLNTASGSLLRALLIRAGAAPALADRVSAAILDWRMSGATARKNGAKAADYLAAGLGYGPPGSQFESTDELRDVLGMTPVLFAQLAPHITVLTDADPDMSTSDPLVAQALTDVAGVADDTATPLQANEAVLRISVVAFGPDHGRYAESVVATANFQTMPPRVNILLRERIRLDDNRAVVASR